jgi:hypothetical protein
VTLASGADVKIGAYEFKLVQSTDNSGYLYTPESLYSDENTIQGLEGTKTANPNVLVWTIDDFAGGGEVKYFSDMIPDTYWYGKCNPRIRGAVTSPPTSAQATVTYTAGSPTEMYTTKVGGKIWWGVNRDVFYSSDNGVTWAQWNSTSLFAAGYVINGITHDGDKPWVTASNGTTRKTKRIDSTTTESTAVSDVTSAAKSNGMAMLEGKAYMWTGGALYEYDTQGTLPITHKDVTLNANPANKVYSPATATPTNYNAGIVASDNSVVFFTAGGGQTIVHEYKYNAATNVFVGRKIWEPAEGFTARQIAYSMGVIYLLGDFGDQAALLGLSLIDRAPLFLSTVGMPYASEVGGTLTTRALSGSYGSSVIGAVDDGTTTYVFVYDAEIDSFSELDQRTIAADGTVYACATVGKKRLTFANKADTTGRVNAWKQDNDTPAGGWGLVTCAHHINFPYDEKDLFSIQVVQDPSIAAGTVQVHYQIDENGTWTDAGTTPAGQKYTNLPVSTKDATTKFRILRLKATGASGARMFNVTARAYINAFQETWRLRVKIDDETANLNSRPSNRQLEAGQLRDYIQTLVNNKNVVEFRDGTTTNIESDTDVTGYKTNTVVVEFPRNSTGITTYKTQGRWTHEAELVLRSVLPN